MLLPFNKKFVMGGLCALLTACTTPVVGNTPQQDLYSALVEYSKLQAYAAEYKEMCYTRDEVDPCYMVVDKVKILDSNAMTLIKKLPKDLASEEAATELKLLNELNNQIRTYIVTNIVKEKANG